MNVLTFSVVMSVAVIALFWFLNDVLPQILFQRKLDKTVRLAEESRRRYEAARRHEATMELRMPDWSTKEFIRSRGWVD